MLRENSFRISNILESNQIVSESTNTGIILMVMKSLWTQSKNWNEEVDERHRLKPTNISFRKESFFKSEI